MAVWSGPGGITVEVIQLDSRALMKVTQTVNGRKYLLGYCATIAELTKHVDLADLVEVVAFPGRGREAWA
ncbi:hypothetical protein ACFMQL_20660 [Nonomuraea fastidiosa]|uniref:hypothetical protein n=1 Tax=Nonomuraea fastidiosa TaxID=46173 RepID=UPI00366F0F27